MSDTFKTAIKLAVLRMLEPLAQILIEAGIGFGDFNTLAKQAYVRAARKADGSSSMNYSRITVLTGLTRKDVTKIAKALDATRKPDHPLQALERDTGATRAERVLRGWWTDPEFKDERGSPAPLPLRGRKKSFAALVLRYAGGPGEFAVLQELLRAKAVRELPDQQIEVISRTFATVHWDESGVQTVGERVRDLLQTLHHNLHHPHRPRYVRFVVNSAVDPKYVPLLLRNLTDQAESFADGFHEALTDTQRTIRPGSKSKEAHRLGVGLFVIDESTVVEPTDKSRKPSRKSG
jgi:hypothetical protein